MDDRALRSEETRDPFALFAMVASPGRAMFSMDPGFLAVLGPRMTACGNACYPWAISGVSVCGLRRGTSLNWRTKALGHGIKSDHGVGGTVVFG